MDKHEAYSLALIAVQDVSGNFAGRIRDAECDVHLGHSSAESDLQWVQSQQEAAMDAAVKDALLAKGAVVVEEDVRGRCYRCPNGDLISGRGELWWHGGLDQEPSDEPSDADDEPPSEHEFDNDKDAANYDA